MAFPILDALNPVTFAAFVQHRTLALVKIGPRLILNSQDIYEIPHKPEYSVFLLKKGACRGAYLVSTRNQYHVNRNS